jgi:hypothetical protein
MDYQKLLAHVLADGRYKKNIEFEYERPHSGHPEGKVKYHIAELEANLEQLKHRLPTDEDYWKLKFLINVHDTFKAEASQAGVQTVDPRSHESLARAFASEFTNDIDLLNIIQYHDENYTLWKQYTSMGYYDNEWFQFLLDTIHNWDLFLAFTIIDGNTKGKDIKKLAWFINQVKQHRQTIVDETWVSTT